MIKKLVPAAVALCALWPAAGADAAGKTRVVVDRFSEPYEDTVSCSQFGPYAFGNHFAGTLSMTITDIRSTDGDLLQTVFKVKQRETDTNTATGKTLPLRTAAHEVWDYATNTRTISGAVWIGNEPGAGTFVQDTGRIAMDIDTHEVHFLAGPHEAFFAGGIDYSVCAALA